MRAPLADLPSPGATACIGVDPLEEIDRSRLPPFPAVRGCSFPANIRTPIDVARRAPATRQNDGLTRQRHVLQNLPGYVRHRLPSAWAGALRGLPALVCGAGPSLDVTLPALAAAAGHAVVFSADSALRALARAGVTADFAVSIDADKVPENCLPAGSPPARVVLASVSPPAWRGARLPAPPLFLSGPQVTDDWLAAQGGARTAVTAAESCGNTALALAEHLGCCPIYVFGMYLAVDGAARLGSSNVVHPEQFSRPAPALRKTSLLARLAAAPDAHTEIFHRLAALGTRAEAALPGLRRTLATAGPAALAAAFRPLVADPDLGRVLGDFALKLMPHLGPPVAGDAADWQLLLDEFTELAALMRQAGTARKLAA